MSLTILAAALAFAASPRGPTHPPPSLCRARERVTFTCPVRGRVLSICGRGSQAVYRYGRPGRVEVEAGSPTFVLEGFSGGGETQVTFHRADVGYLVYQSTVRTAFGPGGNAPEFSEGVVVRRGGKTLADHPCTGPSAGDLTNGMERAPPAGFVER